jgi:Uma2 family endonuclease
MTSLAPPAPRIVYPDSDGKPLSDNTIQFRWIMTLQGNLDFLFHSRTDVFVAGDNLWYPVQGMNKICQAPDVYVVFGRPKRDRGSYKQWEEGNIPLSVVFEVLSPGNSVREMLKKFDFYQQYGVQEYYLIDPDPEHPTLDVWVREGELLKPREAMPRWVSPSMGVRFASGESSLEVQYPDGRPFLSFVELGELQRQTLEEAEQERQRAEQERQRAEQERQRAERLAARLRELGVDPDA